jgi:hypothetical protein
MAAGQWGEAAWLEKQAALVEHRARLAQAESPTR